jgi:uncharacterized membrane protein
MSGTHKSISKPYSGWSPFRRAVLRGLGVALPPLLTIVFLLWVGNSVQRNIIDPIEWTARRVMIWQFSDIHQDVPDQAIMDATRPGHYVYRGQRFVQLTSGQSVPLKVYNTVRRSPGEQFPTTAESLYDRYAEVEWLKPLYFVPVVIALLILSVYLLGKFIAARLGRMLWSQFEQIIDRLPFIRTIYSTVKQVTDILFGDREIEYTRVVAVEYPRRGIWSVGFVTGESMLALRDKAAEPVISVLMPTSPMPATGFTITVRKSETVELALSVDQAFQFVVSCGVVIPGSDVTNAKIKSHIETAVSSEPGDEGPRPLTPTTSDS